MITIYNLSGLPVSKSRNLRGIRAYAGKHVVQHVRIWRTRTGGELAVEFENGATVRTDFADFYVLQQFVRNWRNAHGALLSVNGIARFTVSKQEPRGY